MSVNADDVFDPQNPWDGAGAVEGIGQGDHILPGTAGYVPVTTPPDDTNALAPVSRPIGGTGDKVPGTVAVSVQSVALIMHDNDAQVSVAGVVLVAANPNRRYLMIQNKDATNPIFVRMGVSQNSGGTKIVAGGNYELEINVPVCYVYAYATVAAVLANVVEGSVQGT